MKFVDMRPGQWVLAYRYEYWFGAIDGDMPRALEKLAFGGSGWDVLRKPSDQFEVLEIERVMPKTFISADGQRTHRALVVATADTAGEMLALRDKLFGIGFAADRAVDEETARVIGPYEQRVRDEARAKIHAALPHIVFGARP